MTLGKTSLLNGGATAVRILCALVLNKALAVFVGPAGYTLVGQLLNAIGIATSLSGGAIAAGVIRYTAQYHDDPDRQRAMWRGATRYGLGATALTSLALVVFRVPLADALFADRSLAVVFVVLACAMPFAAAGSLLMAIVNGRKDLRVFTIQSVSVSVLGCAVVIVAAMRFGMAGALIALALNVAAAALVTLALCRKATWLRRASFFGAVAPGTIRPLLGYALMTLTSTVVAAWGQLLVRAHLIDRFGEAATGNWQAVFKVSEVYLTLFTATLGLYYLPRIAEIRRSRELRVEIGRLYRFLLPAATGLAVVLYLLRHWLVTVLFTDRFAGMVDLFGWQLAGDVLKVGSWVLGFVLVGRGMVRWFVLTEVVFTLSWVLLVQALTARYGLTGAPAAFAANYALYWLFMAWLIRRTLREAA